MIVAPTFKGALQTGTANSSFSILLMVLIGKIVNIGYTALLIIILPVLYRPLELMNYG